VKQLIPPAGAITDPMRHQDQRRHQQEKQNAKSDHFGPLSNHHAKSIMPPPLQKRMPAFFS
jgi:hypothetical protein